MKADRHQYEEMRTIFWELPSSRVFLKRCFLTPGTISSVRGNTITLTNVSSKRPSHRTSKLFERKLQC